MSYCTLNNGCYHSCMSISKLGHINKRPMHGYQIGTHKNWRASAHGRWFNGTQTIKHMKYHLAMDAKWRRTELVLKLQRLYTWFIAYLATFNLTVCTIAYSKACLDWTFPLAVMRKAFTGHDLFMYSAQHWPGSGWLSCVCCRMTHMGNPTYMLNPGTKQRIKGYKLMLIFRYGWKCSDFVSNSSACMLQTWHGYKCYNSYITVNYDTILRTLYLYFRTGSMPIYTSVRRPFL